MINIVLTLILALWLLKYGPLNAVIGASVATLISRIIFLGGLIYYRSKNL